MKMKLILFIVLLNIICIKAIKASILIENTRKGIQTSHWIYVEAYGANGNDSNDDKQAIQNALYAAYNVSLSAGKIYYISSTIVFPANKSFQILVVTQIEVFIDTKKLIVTK